MIQRIQTVYLLIVAILGVVVMSMPVGSFITPDSTILEMSNLSITAADGSVNYDPWALFAIQMLSAVIALGTIFLYKKRMVQIRLSLFNIILLVGYYATLGTFVYMMKEDNSFVPAWNVCLPFVSIILNWLAIRAIGSDEALVRSYNSLR